MNLLIKQNPAFTSLFDNLIFNQDWNHQKAFIPAVNIISTDDHFDIQLAAPGKKKSDFQIEEEEGVLTISSEALSYSDEIEKSFARKEFGYNSFKRSFNIPDTVSVDKITAAYKEGILSVSLPKKREALPQPKKLISIK
jgi:HSP20 family protein